MVLRSDIEENRSFLKIKKDTALEIERSFVEKLFEDFLYIVGPARSGSRVFSEAINVNPRFFSARMKMRRFECWKKTNDIDYILERMFRIPFDLLYEKIESDYVDDLKVRLSDAYKNGNFRKILACKAATHFIMDSESMDPSKYTYWTMKSNDFLGLNLCKDALKKSKYVFLIRNPHSTILSQTTRMGRNKGLKNNKRFLLDINRASKYWCLFSRSIIEFIQKYPEDTILIRYEDFIENPEFELNRVFTFADKTKINNNELRFMLEQLKCSATNHPEKYSGISKKPLNRWSSEMKKHEVAIVKFFTSRISRQFGYQFTNIKYELTTPIL